MNDGKGVRTRIRENERDDRGYIIVIDGETEERDEGGGGQGDDFLLISNL